MTESIGKNILKGNLHLSENPALFVSCSYKKNYFFNIKYKYKITFFLRGFILFLITII